MTAPAPVLTVHSDFAQHSFATGDDLIVGSDVRADMRVAHPLVSRAHLLLRFDQGKWTAIDNASKNGMFVNGRRMPAVDIRDGQTINLAKPDGPRLSFEVGHHRGAVGHLPPTAVAAPVINPPAARPPAAPSEDGAGRSSSKRRQPAARQSSTGPLLAAEPSNSMQPTQVSAPAVADGAAGDGTTAVPPQGETVKIPTTQIPPPDGEGRTSAATIGRALDNDIVIPDVLASRYHASLKPTSIGVEIRDKHTANGTFVNGTRVGSALLTEGDVVTIGNVDLVFTGGVLVRQTEAAARTGGLEVREVNFEIEGKRLLENVALTARPGTLTALIGGSGAGKTTLARLISGSTSPTSGSVTFEGHNIHEQYASLRSRIGMVPQDDVVHRQLTVNQALGYAAELRLPPDSSKEDRAQVVAQVIEELGLTKHADTRVDKLSGGQRKRASVALELLTGPSLLILDEPTSGLDPALDLQVMKMLRQLADAGRVVLVVTHSLSYLSLCDQVLLMAPGGKTAYCGSPKDIGEAMGTTDWAEIFSSVGADPEEANRRFLAQAKPLPPVPAGAKPADLGEPAHTSVRKQFSTIARRQVRLIVADRAYFIFLALLPLVMGLLSLTVPGSGRTGFEIANPRGAVPTKPMTLLTLLIVGAVFMGTALTIRDLIGERPIFRREQAVGLSTTAYLGAKIAVFCVFAIVQSVILTTITIMGNGAPTRPAVMLGNATFELYVTVAAVCVAAAIFGLVFSSLARSNEQIMPLLVVSLMAQLVFCGGMVPVTGRFFLDQLSWTMPSRWGYAASASTVDLWTLMPGPLGSKDSHWLHKPGKWLFDMGMLVLLSVIYAGIVWWRTRLKKH
ncbi:ABC transporter ATP-binding protein [Mycobacterium sp. 1164966.3]|uniref:ATP-binding cassette domain-containing protein n=1 Tax=Mycobacterium sp. 1164966.3 TaxID=1856861 RepID=UPI0008008777|nr:ATP-binding cassette domain-containing protein [Mycobacterium sp. 1164966.3]OBA78505.1 ABC transporter ATP-binding protein [Mycobacterium sp. 1164966.3]